MCGISSRGRGGTYWYYKWQSHEAIFITKEGKKSCHKYIGKAGSSAYLKAVEMLVRRTKIEGLEQALHTLELGLSDKRGRSNKTSKGLRIC